MTSPSQRLSSGRWLDYAFVPLLLIVYATSTFAPAPSWLARVTLPAWAGAAEVGTARLILAVLLFIAGLRTAAPTWPKTPLAAMGLLALGVVGRLVPLAAMIAITHALVTVAAPGVSVDIATGLVFVAAMPSANTSTAWTRRADGSLAACVGIVLLTTILAPVVIPTAAAMAAGPAATMGSVGDHVFTGVGYELVAWVVIPMVAGMMVGWLVGARDGVPLGLPGSLGALAAILAVNYLNASRALPQLLVNGHLFPLLGATAASVVLVAVTYAVGGLIARSTRATPEVGVAITFAVGMSNTGLAGALASECFAAPAVILYPIVLCTLVQHVMAALIDSARQRKASPLPSASCTIER